MYKLFFLAFFLHCSMCLSGQLPLIKSPVVSDSLAVDSMMILADRYFYTHRHVSMKYLELLEERLDTSQCDTIVAKYCNLKALVHSEVHRDYSQAEKWSLKMIACSEELGVSKLVATGNQTLGNIYFYLGQWEKAYQAYFKAKEGFYSLENMRGVALTSSSLAVIKSRMHQYRDAVDIGFEAIEILSSTKDTYNLIIAHQNVGTFYKSLSKLDSSMLQQRRALELSLKARDTTNQAYTYGFMADIFILQDDITNAMEFAKKSSQLAEFISDKWLIIDNSKVLADCLMKQKKFQEAEKVLDQAIEMCHSIEATSMLPALYDRIQELYAIKKEYPNAYGALLKWRNFQDSVLGLDQIASMQKLEAKYEERIQEILAQQARDKKQREENRQRQILLLAVILACMAFFLVATWMHARQVSEKVVDFVLLVMVLLIFRFLYLFFDPFSLSAMSGSPWVKITASVLVAVVMGHLHNVIQKAFKNQIQRSVEKSSITK